MRLARRRSPPGHSFHTLTSLDGPWGQQALAIYDASFPVAERESREELARTVDQPRGDGEIRHMRVMVDAAGTVRGISVFTTVHASWMAYLRYIAIHPDARNQHLGPELLADVVAQVRRDGFRHRLLPYLGVVLEVERPDDAADEQERRLRERRIAWYRRNGGRMFEEIDLVTPPMDDGLPPVRYHVMFVRSAPKRLSLGWMRRLMIRAVLVSGYREPEESAYVRHAMGAPLSSGETLGLV